MRTVPNVRRLAWFFAGMCAAAVMPLCAQEKPVVFRGARIETAAGPAIAGGVLVVQNGRIVAVGPASGVAIPDSAEIRDIPGMVIMPGIVDTHSHIGGIINERSGPAQPDLRALDAIDPRDDGFRRALAGGITTVNIMPGSGNVIGGQTVYLKLRRSVDISDLFIRDAEGNPAGGLKMANGTNPIGAAPYPTTRAKTAAIARAEFIKAREYAEKIKRAGDDASKLPPRDLALETLAEVLKGDMPLMLTANRDNDILTALRLRDEFGFKLILDGTAEAPEVIAEIKAAGVPVIGHPTMARPAGERENASMETAAKLHAAGIPIAMESGYEGYVPRTRVILFEAAIAAARGLGQEAALAAITIDAADRVGSLEKGKDADIALYDGDPFEYTTHCTNVVINGEVFPGESDE